MGKRLRNLIEEKLVKQGPEFWTVLCDRVERSEQTIRRWMKIGVPTAHEAFLLALACGLEDEAALKLAKEECPSETARLA